MGRLHDSVGGSRLRVEGVVLVEGEDLLDVGRHRVEPLGAENGFAVESSPVDELAKVAEILRWLHGSPGRTLEQAVQGLPVGLGEATLQLLAEVGVLGFPVGHGGVVVARDDVGHVAHHVGG